MLCCRLATRRKQPCHSVPLFLGTLSRVFSRRPPLCSESGTLSPRLTSEGRPPESPWETGKPVPVPPYCAELPICRIKLPHPPLSSIHVDLFLLLSWIGSHHKVPDTQPGLEDTGHNGRRTTVTFSLAGSLEDENACTISLCTLSPLLTLKLP